MLTHEIVPILYSSDIRASIAFFKDVLGFSDSWEWDDPPGFGGVTNGECRVFFCLRGQGQPGSWLSIMIDDVDVYHNEIVSRGAVIVKGPETYPWGIREMLVQAPDGHMLRIGSEADCD